MKPTEIRTICDLQSNHRRYRISCRWAERIGWCVGVLFLALFSYFLQWDLLYALYSLPALGGYILLAWMNFKKMDAALADIPSEEKMVGNFHLDEYCRSKSLVKLKRTWWKQLLFMSKCRSKGNILQRKELSQRLYVDWLDYDNRIKNKYWDKYELLDLYQTLNKENDVTVSRNHFHSELKDSHPDINLRLRFIIENFLIPSNVKQN